MDFLIEFLLEIVLEGCFMLSTEKKVPLAIRILLGTVLAAIYLLLVGAIVYLAISNHSILMFVMAILVAALVAGGFYKNYVKIKKK